MKGPASLLARAAAEASNGQGTTPWFHHARLRDGSSYLRWAGLFEFVVSADGGRIAGRALADISFESFQSYLLGGVFSFALIKRGFDPLHATAVVVDSGAIGFLGDTGQGKSSLASAFLQAGYLLLTDDVLVLQAENQGFTAYAGPPRIKLFPSIARTVFGGKLPKTRMNPLAHKLIIPLRGNQFHKAPVPLRALYVLKPRPADRRGTRIYLRRLSLRRSFEALIRSAFNGYITEPERLQNQLDLYSRIASRVPITLLSYPRTVASLPQVRAAILADLKR